MNIITSDIYHDIYFSRADGRAEKEAVFLRGNNLPDRWHGRDDFTILEAGFGTGLSFLVTSNAFLATTNSTQRLHYISFEQYPLTPDQIRAALQPWWNDFEPLATDLITAYPLPVPAWHRRILKDRIFLTLIIGDINQHLPQADVAVDAWYLDGFAPAKNPEMWSDIVFDQMARLSATGATAATYSSARVVKDGLTRAGFKAQKTQGHGYKSDRLTATYTGQGRAPLSTRRGQRVAILGGGLAGTATAWALKQNGHHPVIIAPGGLHDQASGNARGLYNPRLSASFSGGAPFYAAAFAQFIAFLRAHDPAATGWSATGALHLLRSDEMIAKADGVVNAWGWGAAGQAMIVDAAVASERAGIPLALPALWLPTSGSVDPRALCRLYANDIEIRPDLPDTYDTVVVANGWGAAAHPALTSLPLRAVRGQIQTVRATPISLGLKTHLCYGGYITPADETGHVMGATFTRDDTGLDIRTVDQDQILSVAATHTGLVFTAGDVIAARAGLRVTTPDHQPVIGMVAGQEIPMYVSTAHGSHGLLSTHLAGTQIAALVSGLPPGLPRAVMALMDPGRFRR